MSRQWCIPGVVFLLAATILSALAAVSLPYMTALDIARVHFKGSAGAGDTTAVTKELRFGTWGYCAYDQNDNRLCSPAHNAYTTTVHNPTDDNFVIIGPSWTRGLAVHPVAAGVTFLALLTSLSTHVTIQLVASLMSFLAALLTLIAFAIDIALYAFIKHQMNKIGNVKANTNTAPGFWLTFAALLLTLLAGCTVCFGRRRNRMYNATTNASSYPMAGKTGNFWSRFRRN